MLIALLVCLCSTLAGVGLLKALRLQISGADLPFLAPPVCLAVWALLIGAAALLRVPLKSVLIPFWAITLGAAAYGTARLAWGNTSWREISSQATDLVVVLIAACFATLPFAWYGYRSFLGSPAQDGWSYVALGQYLWEYPRGVEGGLAPIYQYASHLAGTRFIAAGLLGMLSPLGGKAGDTQATVGYLLLFAFFAQASACSYLGAVAGFSRLARSALVMLVVASTWSTFVLTTNNFDNALALSFTPAAVALVAAAAPRDRGSGIALGVLIAGFAVVYPEMFPLFLVAVCAWACDRLVLATAEERRQLIRSVLIPCVACTAVLATAFLEPTWHFLLGQVSASAAASKPGWDVAGFLPPGRAPFAFFGLAPALSAHPGYAWMPGLIGLVSSIAVIAVIAGLAVSVRRRRFGVLFAFLFSCAGVAYLVLVQSYGYGAYKVSLLSWWLCVLLAVEGYRSIFRWLDRRSPRRFLLLRRFAVTIAGFCVLVMLAFTAEALVRSTRNLADKTIDPFEEVEAISAIVGPAPVLVVLPEAISNSWAMYYLRNVHAKFASFAGFAAQSHVLPLMQRSEPIEMKDVRFILGDASSEGLERGGRTRWTDRKYRLIETGAANFAILDEVSNPNGVENWNGKSGLWLGNKEAHVEVVANRDGTALLGAEVSQGPSRPESNGRTLRVRRDDGVAEEFRVEGTGPRTFAVPIRTGRNLFSIWVDDKPSVAVLSNGDPRTLLLGMRGLDATFLPDAATAAAPK